MERGGDCTVEVGRKEDADAEPPAPKPGRPYISCGSARASYGTANPLDGGAPRSALEPYCPYSTRLCLLLAEGGVDFTMVKIDLTAVQGWYSAAFKPGDAPAMWGTPGGKSVSEGWVGGSRECRDRAVAAHEGVRRANEARASVSEADVAAFGETLIFGGLAPRIAGSTHPKGSKVFAFMLKKTSSTCVESTSELGWPVASMAWGARNLISTQSGCRNGDGVARPRR